MSWNHRLHGRTARSILAVLCLSAAQDAHAESQCTTERYAAMSRCKTGVHKCPNEQNNFITKCMEEAALIKNRAENSAAAKEKESLLAELDRLDGVLKMPLLTFSKSPDGTVSSQPLRRKDSSVVRISDSIAATQSILDATRNAVNVFNWNKTASVDVKKKNDGKKGDPAADPEPPEEEEKDSTEKNTIGAKEKALTRTAEKDLQSGRPEAAEAALDEVIKNNPANTQALAMRSMAHLQQGRSEKALNDAGEALRLDAQNKLAGEVKAYAESAQRGQGLRPLKQKPDFSRFLSPENDSPAGTRRDSTAQGSSRAPGAWPAGRGADSGSQIAAFTRQATPSDLMLQSALRKMQLGDMTGALLEATRAISADKSNAKAWALRAAISNKLKNYEAAAKDADESLKIDPQNVQALIERSYARYNMGDYAAALSDVTQALKIDPRSALAYLYRAMILEKLDRFQEALGDYETAARLDPSLKPLLTEAEKRLSGKSEPAGKSAKRRGTKVVAGLGTLGLLILAAGALLRRPASTTTPASADAAVSLARPEPPQDAVPGELLGGNYRIERELARGGMGVVYEAVDLKLQRSVAIKHLNNDTYADPRLRERFLQEARLVAKLRHPHIAEIFSVVGEDDLYLVFELVRGESLQELIDRKVRLKPAEALAVLKDIVSALDYAHSEKIIHRDLKPSNVMIDKNGRAKVMDFGIAHEARTMSHDTQTSAWGTPPYMAPEQEMGRVSLRSDLYALAVMSYQLLAGQLPFAGPYYLEKKLKKDFPPLTRLHPGLSGSIDGFFDKSLDPEPEKRHASAGEFLAALRTAARTPNEDFS